MVKKFADIAKGKCKFGRRNMRNAMVMEMRRQEQLKRGTKVSGKGKQVTVAAQEVPITQRAGHPLVKTKAKPAEWKTIPGKAITVDLARVPWLPDDWGQGVKMTNPISRSRPGQGGTYTVWVAPCGRVFYHRYAMEEFLGRTLSVKDGFNGQRRLAQLQGKRTDEKKFFEILTPAERKRLPKADELHFCIVSARRTETAEGLQGIAQVQALFQSAAVEPTWYVDEPSLQEYKKLGLKAVVGGKLCPARNKCLVDAARLGKACVEVSDDISRWEYYDGAQAQDGSDDAVNAAHAAATCHIITPVAAARFLLAKLRAAQALAPDKSKAPHLAGVYPLGSCSRAFGGPVIQNQHFILGDFFVVDVGSKLRFDEEMTLKEDYDFTAQHIFTHGSVIRCTRMTIAAKHQTNAGGACAIRDKKGLEEQKNIAILKRRGEVAARHPQPHQAEERSDDAVARGRRCDGHGQGRRCSREGGLEEGGWRSREEGWEAEGEAEAAEGEGQQGARGVQAHRTCRQGWERMQVAVHQRSRGRSFWEDGAVLAGGVLLQGWQGCPEEVWSRGSALRHQARHAPAALG
mmetsp:Transcript_93836/g.247830  ORF Transcript_93836/g.247830 Transcript_93836/m.247830 type:complete len:573 (-) Transcript_93836:48-1766(-)